MNLYADPDGLSDLSPKTITARMEAHDFEVLPSMYLVEHLGEMTKPNRAKAGEVLLDRMELEPDERDLLNRAGPVALIHYLLAFKRRFACEVHEVNRCATEVVGGLAKLITDNEESLGAPMQVVIAGKVKFESEQVLPYKAGPFRINGPEEEAETKKDPEFPEMQTFEERAQNLQGESQADALVTAIGRSIYEIEKAALIDPAASLHVTPFHLWGEDDKRLWIASVEHSPKAEKHVRTKQGTLARTLVEDAEKALRIIQKRFNIYLPDEE